MNSFADLCFTTYFHLLISPLFVTFAHGIICVVCSVQAEGLVKGRRRRGGVCPRPHVPVLQHHIGRQSLNINPGGLNMAAIRGSNEPSQSFHSATVSMTIAAATSASALEYRLYGVIQDVVFTHQPHFSCSLLSLICLSTNQNIQLIHSLLIRIEWTTGNGILIIFTLARL